MRELLRLIEANRERIEKARNEFFGYSTECPVRPGQHVGRAFGRTDVAGSTRLVPASSACTREQCEACRLSGRGLHWEALDEDDSISGLLAGYGDQTRYSYGGQVTEVIALIVAASPLGPP